MTTIDPSYPSRSSTIFRALKYFCGMLAVVIAAMVSGIALLVLLIWLRKEYPGILPQQILDDSLVDWSEKAVAVAIGLAGSVAVLAISLLTLQNQREVERERKEREDADNKERKEREDAIRKEQDDRRTNEKQAREKSEMLAHVRKYQSLCDAIENLFIEADYVASLVIAPVTKGDVAADGQRARRLEARLEVAQSAVWTSIEAVCSLEPEHYATVSDNNEQRLRVLPDLWAEYFEKKTPLSQVYLRETGFFGLERKDGGRVWKIHKIMAPLKVSRVDPNTQRRLRLFVTDSVVHNFKKKALEGERSLAEAGDLDRIQRRHDIKSSVDRLIGLFELEEVVHNRIEKFNEYITSSIASLLTSQGQLREDFEPGYIPDSVELCIERAENVSNEFVEKLKAYKIPEVRESLKNLAL